MPVFTAGAGYGKAIAAAMGVPYYEYSHQEGHIEAIRFYSSLKHVNPLICFHFSGGTTEALLVDDDRGIFEIVGGSKDIAYGQVLDACSVFHWGWIFLAGKRWIRWRCAPSVTAIF